MKNKRFNLFDLLIILIVIGVGLGVLFRARIKDAVFPGESANFTVTLDVLSMPNDCALSLTEGVKLYTAQKKNVFGKVAEIEISPVKDTVFVGDKEVIAPSEHYSSAVIIVTVEGYILDGAYYTKDDDMILIRSEFGLMTEDAYFRGAIQSVEVTGNG